MRKFLLNRKGLTVVETLVVAVITVAVAVSVMGLLSNGSRGKAGEFSNDMNALKVTTPVFSENTTGTFSINGTGSTGLPQDINFN